MNNPRKIVDDVYFLGAIDWDRRLFDALIPLPDGTSYNCYLVRGSNFTALIDTVDPTKWDTLAAQLADVARLDYVVIQHVEQDHSGCLPMVLARYPMAKVVTNLKCKSFLIDHLHIAEERFFPIEDNAILSLGGKTLRFVLTPWVHMPETMCTYLEEDQLLFTCDFFGAHLATSDMFAVERSVLEPAKRYYAEIMMAFAPFITKNLEKLAPLPLQMICPSHGPIHRRPTFIIEAYREWTTDPPKNLVCLPFVSMHGSTQMMVNYLTGALIDRGVSVQPFDLSVADLGKITMCLVDAATIVIGTPTVHAGPHPATVNVAFLANALKPKAKYATVIGSLGWGGKTVEKLTGLMSNLNLEYFNPILVKGMPRPEHYAHLDQLAQNIAEKHRILT